METKKCPRCGAIKPLAEFNKDRTRLDGHYPWCRECSRAANAAHYKANVTKRCAENRARYAEDPVHRARHLVRLASKRRGITVTYKWVAERLLRGRCEVTGIPFQFAQVRGKSKNPFAPSLDRIDPHGDYTPDNTQVVIHAFNQAKGEMSQSEVCGLIKRMAEVL